MAAKTQISIELDRRRKALRSVRALLEKNEHDILWTLLRFIGDESNRCQISVRELANEIHRSESTVKRAVRSLERMGFVASTPTVGRDGRQANEYAVMWGTIADSGRFGECDREAVSLESAPHCERGVRGRWSSKVPLVVHGMTGVPMNGHELAIGTEDVGSVNLTEPVRSNRPSRSGQFDRAGQVNLTEPSLSHVLPSSETYSTPTRRQATITDADWLVVLDEMKIFGIWEDKAKQSIAFAQQKGLTPQTVSGLIRFAAGKVIARANDGTPLGQWHLPSPDNLDLTQQQPDRLYWWGPALVLARIERHSPWMGIATDWPRVTGERADEYNHAQAWLAEHAKKKSQQQTTHDKADEEAAKAKAFHAETERLEAEHADAIAALTVEQAIGLLPSFLRKSQGEADPRVGRQRPHFLRMFAASLVPQPSSFNSESQ